MAKINYSYKFRIYPNINQKTQIAQHIGSSRFLYNYFLNKRINLYKDEGKFMSYYDCARELKGLKEEYEWLKESNAQSLQASLENLDKAYTNFFKTKKGFPKFKSKRFSKQSYKVKQGVKIFDKYIQIPKLKKVKCVYDRKVEGKILSATISRNSANQYFVSVNVEQEKEIPAKVKVEDSKVVGIDMGIKSLAILSNKKVIPNLKLTKLFARNLKLKQRKLAKKELGSKRYYLAKLRLARLHSHIANKRLDYIHKATTKIINENQVVILEDLAVSNMVKNHKLASSISDASWSEFKRQLEYKSKWQGKAIYEIDRFYPTSKQCSSCGFIHQGLKLSDRTFKCPKCNHIQDRDIQAAQNIKTFGLKDILNQTTYGKWECDDRRGYQLWQQDKTCFYFDCETVADEAITKPSKILISNC